MAFNMDPKKCPMPTQDPNVRNKNFKEVALGYTAAVSYTHLDVYKRQGIYRFQILGHIGFAFLRVELAAIGGMVFVPAAADDAFPLSLIHI